LPTAIKSVLCHEKTRDILFLERPQGAREIKFREFSSDIKGRENWWGTAWIWHESDEVWRKVILCFTLANLYYCEEKLKFLHSHRMSSVKKNPTEWNKISLFYSVLFYITYIFTSTPFYVGDKLIFRYKLCKSFGKRKALSKDKIPLGVSK